MHLLPFSYLGLWLQPGRMRPPSSLRCDNNTFVDKQSARCTSSLTVICRELRSGYRVCVAAEACQRREHDAVRERGVADADRAEERGRGARVRGDVSGEAVRVGASLGLGECRGSVQGALVCFRA